MGRGEQQVPNVRWEVLDEVEEEVEVGDWDRWVRDHPLGQVQQTGAWGDGKRGEGWQVVRWTLAAGGVMAGGAQILCKKTRLGWLGFLNKGPLWVEGNGVDLGSVLRSLAHWQQRRGCRALVVQLPDDWKGDAEKEMREVGFQRERLLGIIESTLTVDMREGWEAVQKKFRRTVRREVRQAEERGVTIREGGEEDLGEFFRLMCRTCERQGVRPNPPNEVAVQALWRSLTLGARPRLHFAVHEGKCLAGGLSFLYQGRATFWKKGWDQSRPELHVNTCLTWDAIRWAVVEGGQTFDFVSLDRDIAVAMQSGAVLPSDVARRRDYFNLGFGGQGRVLPRAMIRFSSPWMAWIYRVAVSDSVRPRVRRMMRRLAVG